MATRRRRLAALSALFLLSPAARASQTLDGTYTDIWYSSAGAWADSGAAKGLEITSGSTTKAVTYPGAPWSQTTIEYDIGTTASSYSSNYSSASYTTVTESNLSTGTTNQSYYKWTAGSLTIERTETWDDADKVVVQKVSVTNNSTSNVTNFRYMIGMDPDQDSSAGSSSTLNDVLDTDGDGVPDMAVSSGSLSGWAVAYGACDEAKQDFGHTTPWATDADAVFVDYAGASADNAMHARHKENTIAAGAVATFYVLFTWDTTSALAQSQYTAAAATKCPTVCDNDVDGYDSTAAGCGGTDCDDTDPGVHPGGTETCDGEDDDCDGTVDDGVTTAYYRDADSDGYGNASVTTAACSAPTGYVANSTDCDDSRSSVKPGGIEVCNSRDDDCDGSTDEGVTATYYADADSDGFGNASVTSTGCTLPSGYVTNKTDCDDTSAVSYPGASELCDSLDNDCDGTVDDGASKTWYYDADGDGYGTSASTASTCTAPAGYVSTKTDCNDADATAYPGASEVCDGADDDCDGSTDEGVTTTYYKDADKDGYGLSSSSTTGCSAPSGYVTDKTDCNDGAAAAHPGATEICDGIDDDCDGAVDEGVKTTYYRDADSDGYGTSATSTTGCSAAAGYVADKTDCDDADATAFPGATEACDGVDDDCDGAIDDGAKVTYYRDADGDLHGDASRSSTACSAPTGYVTAGDDCNDAKSTIYPGAGEACDGIDNDCDGAIDDGVTTTWYADGDKDGYGDASKTSAGCTPPSGYVADGTDCDDKTFATNPGADERCDGIDDDCDGATDEADAVDPTAWYADADADGYGDAAISTVQCDAPSGTVDDGTDCDDTDPDAYPGATDVPYDGVDQDCSGADLTDADGDGVDATVAGGFDCDDSNAGVNPSAAEEADAIDNDCDGAVDEGTDWADDDGDGFTEEGGDCDDADATVSPAGVEECDGVDEDCDGTSDEGTGCYDDDADGFTEDGGDCHDADPAVNPGATEDYANGLDDDCDGVTDTGAVDADADGVASNAGDCDDANPDVRPGLPETANGLDDDCDGTADEGTTAFDDDGDGVTEDDGDCDDTDADTFPGATEDPADGADDDCDGAVDEGSESVDDDGDGVSEEGGDCDDDDPAVNPGADETQNGIDDDCDGEADDHTYDLDDDGFSLEDGDCDDRDGWSHPDAEEVCDGLDNDCDGAVDDGCGDDTGVTETPGCQCDASASPAGVAPFLLALIALRRRKNS